MFFFLSHLHRESRGAPMAADTLILRIFFFYIGKRADSIRNKKGTRCGGVPWRSLKWAPLFVTGGMIHSAAAAASFFFPLSFPFTHTYVYVSRSTSIDISIPIYAPPFATHSSPPPYTLVSSCKHPPTFDLAVFVIETKEARPIAGLLIRSQAIPVFFFSSLSSLTKN